MRSLRMFARVARSARPQHFPSRISTRLSCVSQIPRSINIQRPIASSFSTSCAWRNGDSVNQELAAKLEQEINMENEIRDHETLPAPLREYLDNCPFTLVDTPGNEEVKLERVYGDEKITVSFSVADLNNMGEEGEDGLEDESAMLDEIDEDAGDLSGAQSGGANTKGAINKGHTSGGNIRVAPEDRIAPADREELADEEGLEEDDHEPGFPAHIFIKVERPGKGALQIDTVASDGVIIIENIYYYKDAKHADSDNFADELASRHLYTGPPFNNLDEELQLMFDKYLDERGINTTLALFVPEYIDFKEQREYMTWLQDLKQFVA